eukprot:scaffold24303_cov137-Cylindrotheca_fusiformis.AAC.2
MIPMPATSISVAATFSCSAATVPMSCSLYEPSQSTCCPGNEGEGNNGDSCNFCGDGGSEFPDLETYGNATCSELELGAIFVQSGTQCDIYKNQFEPLCCPNFAGDGNGGGNGGGDGGGDGGGSDGKNCYICGSADVAMTKADSTIFGGGDDGEDVTCSEIQADLNNTEFCSLTLQIFNSFINLPSVCGCEGAEAPNLPECSPCSGGSVIPGATVPGETYSCADAIELSKHFKDPELCLSGQNNATDMEEFQSACCLSIGDGGGNSGGDGGGGNSGGDGGGGTSGGGDDGDDSGCGHTTKVGWLVATGLALFSFPLF